MEGGNDKLLETTVLKEIIENLSPEELEEYKKIKNDLSDFLIEPGIWSGDFSRWIDQNLIFLGGLSKAIASFAEFKNRRKTKQNLLEVEHYYNIIVKMADKNNIPEKEKFINWLNNADTKLLKNVADTLELVGDFYAIYSTNLWMKEVGYKIIKN